MRRTMMQSIAGKVATVAMAAALMLTGCGSTAAKSDTTVRVGSLKGPTTMGIVQMMKSAEDGTAAGTYEFRMETQADVLMASMVSGDLDIALVPANMASVLYNKTEGGVAVIDVNTLGVLYLVTGNPEVSSLADLSGKTLLMTGQGASPEYVVNYLLSGLGITDCTLEFHSEATEIAALLKSDANAVAVLPQPFATAAALQNPDLTTSVSLNEAWDASGTDSKLLTGVTVVQKSFLEAHPDAVKAFLEDHKKSADLSASDVEGTAKLVVEKGIVEKEPMAKKALPLCGITCLTGDEMQKALSGYLQVLFDQNPKSVGGSMPAEDFYQKF